MSDYLTVVLQLPEKQDQRMAIAEIIRLDTYFHGARIIAVSMEDEITKIERYEQLYGDLSSDEYCGSEGGDS